MRIHSPAAHQFGHRSRGMTMFCVRSIMTVLRTIAPVAVATAFALLTLACGDASESSPRGSPTATPSSETGGSDIFDRADDLEGGVTRVPNVEAAERLLGWRSLHSSHSSFQEAGNPFIVHDPQEPPDLYVVFSTLDASEVQMVQRVMSQDDFEGLVADVSPERVGGFNVYFTSEVDVNHGVFLTGESSGETPVVAAISSRSAIDSIRKFIRGLSLDGGLTLAH